MESCKYTILPFRPGDIVAVREKSKSLEVIQDSIRSNRNQYPWLEWDMNLLAGKFMAYP
jgi:small subunit ribosomal protein S4